MGGCAAGRVADVVVAVVAEGDIDDATVGKVAQMAEVVLDGETVFDARHDRFHPVLLVLPQFLRVSGAAYGVGMGAEDFVYAVEYHVGILMGRTGRQRGYLGKTLSRLGLGQISHHGGGVEPSVGHLVQVYEDARVAGAEVHPLREEHGRVAVGVEGEGASVYALGFGEEACPAGEPLE